MPLQRGRHPSVAPMRITTALPDDNRRLCGGDIMHIFWWP